MIISKNNEASEKKGSIIDSVSTPLKFFALVVLASEFILASIAKSAEESDRTYLIFGMIGVLVLMIIVVTLIEVLKTRTPGIRDQNHSQSVDSMDVGALFENNDSPEFSALFRQHLKKADKIHMIGTGFNILRRDAFRILLDRCIKSDCEVKIYAANPFSPNVQTRLIEEEMGKHVPMIGQQGLINWIRDLLEIKVNLNKSSNFSLNLFPFYPTYALFIFDEHEYFFYPYGYAQLGTLSPVSHFSKCIKKHHSMVEFFDKQINFISECSSNAELVFNIQDSKPVGMNDLTAFAVYLIPPINSQLYKFGSEVLEYDVHTSTKLDANEWHSSIGTASDFGFHLTVADALYCTHPKDVDLICREVEFIAKRIQPIKLKFRLEKNFPNEQGIALVCEDVTGQLESLHHDIVERVYRKSAASNYSSSLGRIARSDRDSNQERARYMIQHYNAPYILQAYKPHFSLLSSVKSEEKELLFTDIKNRSEKFKIESELQMHTIAVMHRPDPKRPWQILKKYRLGGN